MLNPEPRPEPPIRLTTEVRDDPGRSTVPAEPRSFAAWDTVRRSARAEFDPEAFIRSPPEAAKAPVALDEEVAARRALVVIPCLNEAPLIAEVIAEILEDDGLVDPMVLVADGGSIDGSSEIVAGIAARDPRVRLIANPGKLQSAGVNLAARQAGEDRPWIVRIDAHADYPPNFVSTLIAEARRTGAQSVVVAMKTEGKGAFQRAVAAAQNSRLGAGGAVHRMRSPGGWVDHGHHALFNREAFAAIGGYDESFSHNEDAELDLRLIHAGARIWLTDRTRIVYRPRTTPRALWKQYVSYGKGRARTALKHRAPLKLRQALPLAVAPAVLGLVTSPLYWPLAVPAVMWAATSLIYGAVLAARRKDFAVLMSGGAAMIMHLAWSLGFWMQLAAWIAKGGRFDPPPTAQLGATPVAS